MGKGQLEELSPPPWLPPAGRRRTARLTLRRRKPGGPWEGGPPGQGCHEDARPTCSPTVFGVEGRKLVRAMMTRTAGSIVQRRTLVGALSTPEGSQG